MKKIIEFFTPKKVKSFQKNDQASVNNSETDFAKIIGKDVMIEILKKLDMPNLMNALLVNKFWNLLASNNNVWKSALAKENKHIQYNCIVELAERDKKNIRRMLVLRGIHIEHQRLNKQIKSIENYSNISPVSTNIDSEIVLGPIAAFANPISAYETLGSNVYGFFSKLGDRKLLARSNERLRALRSEMLVYSANDERLNAPSTSSEDDDTLNQSSDSVSTESSVEMLSFPISPVRKRNDEYLSNPITLEMIEL